MKKHKDKLKYSIDKKKHEAIISVKSDDPEDWDKYIKGIRVMVGNDAVLFYKKNPDKTYYGKINGHSFKVSYESAQVMKIGQQPYCIEEDVIQFVTLN